MSNWLQRPATQHLLTSLGAVAAGVVLPLYLPKEWAMTVATASAVGGVGGNLVSNFLAKFFDRRLLELTPGDQTVKAVALGNLGLIAQTRGELAEAERLLREALTIEKQLGGLEGQAIQLGNLDLIAQTRGELAEARRLWTEALDLFTRAGAKPQQEQAQRLLDALPQG